MPTTSIHYQQKIQQEFQNFGREDLPDFPRPKIASKVIHLQLDGEYRIRNFEKSKPLKNNTVNRIQRKNAKCNTQLKKLHRCTSSIKQSIYSSNDERVDSSNQSSDQEGKQNSNIIKLRNGKLNYYALEAPVHPFTSWLKRPNYRRKKTSTKSHVSFFTTQIIGHGQSFRFRSSDEWSMLLQSRKHNSRMNAEKYKLKKYCWIGLEFVDPNQMKIEDTTGSVWISEKYQLPLESCSQLVWHYCSY